MSQRRLWMAPCPYFQLIAPAHKDFQTSPRLCFALIDQKLRKRILDVNQNSLMFLCYKVFLIKSWSVHFLWNRIWDLRYGLIKSTTFITFWKISKKEMTSVPKLFLLDFPNPTFIPFPTSTLDSRLIGIAQRRTYININIMTLLSCVQKEEKKKNFPKFKCKCSFWAGKRNIQ